MFGAAGRWMLVVARLLRRWNAPVVFGERIYCRGLDCFRRPLICVFSLPPLSDQMRPMKTSPPDRSTISCPGNRAGSSSDSKRITPPFIRRPTKWGGKRNEGAGDFCHNTKTPALGNNGKRKIKMQTRAPPHGQPHSSHVRSVG